MYCYLFNGSICICYVHEVMTFGSSNKIKQNTQKLKFPYKEYIILALDPSQGRGGRHELIKFISTVSLRPARPIVQNKIKKRKSTYII